MTAPGTAITFTPLAPPRLTPEAERARMLQIAAEFLATHPGPEELIAFAEAFSAS